MENQGRVLETAPGFKELYVFEDGSEWVVSTVNLDETLGRNSFTRLAGMMGAIAGGTAESGEETAVFKAIRDDDDGKVVGYDTSHEGTLAMTNGPDSRQRALDIIEDIEMNRTGQV